MNIIITGKNFDLTPALESYVREKVAKFNKYDHKIISVSVILSVDDGHHKRGDIYSAEVIIDRAGKNIVAKETKDEMYAAVDSLTEKTKFILEKNKKGKFKKMAKYKDIIRGIIKPNK